MTYFKGWYEKAFNKLLRDEGIYSNNQFDKGGKTIYGITKKNYPETFEQIYFLYNAGKIDDALFKAKEFYLKYWNDLYNELNYQLAEKIFNLSVNIGKGRAVKILQKTLNVYYNLNLEIDGIFGQKTLKEILSNFQPGVRACYIFELLKYHNSIIENSPTQKKFQIGWFVRDVS